MKNNNGIIVITGAAGFIGSCLLSYLNRQGFHKLILVDDFSRPDKALNLNGKRFDQKIEREFFFGWLSEKKPLINFVFHIGARTNTAEFDYTVHQHLNVEYSQNIWNYCTVNNVPLVYASSAATYGSGECGYDDDHKIVHSLRPLNAYGISKNEFDKWVLNQVAHPPYWAGLKFFNVYGPNEYHKTRMASMVFHSFNQIQSTGGVKLFKSHRPDFKDGEQLRDFVYVKDIIKVCYWLMNHQPVSGIFNLGTGKARTFADLVKFTYAGLNMPSNIEYIDMPEDIRGNYQYFTQANMNKLRKVGYSDKFYSLEAGIDDYVRNYLAFKKYY